MKSSKSAASWKIRIFLALLFGLLLFHPGQNTFTAFAKVKSISVTNLPAKTLTLKKGKKFTLKVKVTVSDKSSKKVTYTSSKKAVATVDSKGKISAKKNGSTKITIASKADKKKKLVIKLTVGTPVSKLTLNRKTASLEEGGKLTLKATLAPKKPSNKKVVWSSSNPKTATVTSGGVVKGIKAGTAKITCTAADGSGKKAVCTITVTSAEKEGSKTEESKTEESKTEETKKSEENPGTEEPAAIPFDKAISCSIDKTVEVSGKDKWFVYKVTPAARKYVTVLFYPCFSNDFEVSLYQETTSGQKQIGAPEKPGKEGIYFEYGSDSHFTLQAGKASFLVIHNLSGSSNPCQFRIIDVDNEIAYRRYPVETGKSVSADVAEKISLTAGERSRVFFFTPHQTAVYGFALSDSSSDDFAFTVYDMNSGENLFDKHGIEQSPEEGSRSFRASCELTQGQKYYLILEKGSSLKGKTFSADFRLSQSKNVSVAFDGNGGTLINENGEEGNRFVYQYQQGDNYKPIPQVWNPLNFDGKAFAGWGTSASANPADALDLSTAAVNEEKTFYAIWGKQVSVTFDANGGVFFYNEKTGTSQTQVSVQYPEGGYLRKEFAGIVYIYFQDPTRDGYTFAGWANSPGAGAAGVLDLSSRKAQDGSVYYAVWSR